MNQRAICPIYFAIDNADFEFIDIMIKTKLCCIAEEETLTRMVKQKLNRSLKLILQTYYSQDKLQRIFLDSCSFANLEMLRYLIKFYGTWSRGSQSMTTLWGDFYFGQDLVNEGLVCGAKNGHTNVVSFLLQNLSFKFHIYTNSALHVACRNRDFAIVKLLLDHLTENPQLGYINYKNEMGYTALMEACKHKEVEIVKLLLKQDDLQINLQDSEGKTAFYHACQTLSLECVELLLQHPNIEIKSNREILPLHNLLNLDYTHLELTTDEFIELVEHNELGYFVEKDVIMKERWTKMFEFLCSLPNIDINDRDVMGRTVLHCACIRWQSNPGTHNELGLLKMILQQPNVDINAPDENGDTALRMAVKAKNSKIIQEIVNYCMERGIEPISDRLPPFPMKLLYNL